MAVTIVISNIAMMKVRKGKPLELKPIQLQKANRKKSYTKPRRCQSCNFNCNLTSSFCPCCGRKLLSIWVEAKQQIPSFPEYREQTSPRKRKLRAIEPTKFTPPPVDYPQQQNHQSNNQLSASEIDHQRQLLIEGQDILPPKDNSQQVEVGSKHSVQPPKDNSQQVEVGSKHSVQARRKDHPLEKFSERPQKAETCNAKNIEVDHNVIPTSIQLWTSKFRRVLSLLMHYKGKASHDRKKALTSDKRKIISRSVKLLENDLTRIINDGELSVNTTEKCKNLLMKAASLEKSLLIVEFDKQDLIDKSDVCVKIKGELVGFRGEIKKKIKEQSSVATAKHNEDELVKPTKKVTCKIPSQSLPEENPFDCIVFKSCERLRKHLFETTEGFLYSQVVFIGKKRVIVTFYETNIDGEYGLKLCVYNPTTSQNSVIMLSQHDLLYLLPCPAVYYRKCEVLLKKNYIVDHWKKSIGNIVRRIGWTVSGGYSITNRKIHNSCITLHIGSYRTVRLLISIEYLSKLRLRISAFDILSCAVYKTTIDSKELHLVIDNFSEAMKSGNREHCMSLVCRNLWLTYTTFGFEFTFSGQNLKFPRRDIPEFCKNRELFSNSEDEKRSKYLASFQTCAAQASRIGYKMQLKWLELEKIKCANASIRIQKATRAFKARKAVQQKLNDKMLQIKVATFLQKMQRMRKAICLLNKQKKIEHHENFGKHYKCGRKLDNTYIILDVKVHGTTTSSLEIHEILVVACHPVSFQKAFLKISHTDIHLTISSHFDKPTRKEIVLAIIDKIQIFRSKEKNVLALSYSGKRRKN